MQTNLNDFLIYHNHITVLLLLLLLLSSSIHPTIPTGYHRISTIPLLVATKGPREPADLAQEQFVKVQLLASTMDGAELPVGEATVPIADPMTESMNSWCLFEQTLGTALLICFFISWSISIRSR